MSAFIYIAGENDDEARARVFYILKKYTSATLLVRAINLYRQFLDEFEQAIRRPDVIIDYSDDLVRFLRFLEPMEYAQPLLTDPKRRVEAFDLLRQAIKFRSYIWGRRYQELGADDPGDFFYKLGYRFADEDSIDVFGKASLSGSLISLLLGTIGKKGQVYLDNPRKAGGHNARAVMRWTYESIFFDSVSFNSIPPITFPEHLPICPPCNEKGKGEIWSGQKIPVTGIWEPWPVDIRMGVRCPNYYLAGDTASQYQMEGTDTFEDVRWRLIWKENRYENGHIPREEEEYFRPVLAAGLQTIMRAAMPGEICPESGEWFAPHLDGKTIHMNAGKVMPGPEFGNTGSVTWYRKK